MRQDVCWELGYRGAQAGADLPSRGFGSGGGMRAFKKQAWWEPRKGGRGLGGVLMSFCVLSERASSFPPSGSEPEWLCGLGTPHLSIWGRDAPLPKRDSFGGHMAGLPLQLVTYLPAGSSPGRET